MGLLANCIDKAGKLISPLEKDIFLKRQKDYVEAGYAAHDASIRVVQDAMGDLVDERKSILEQLGIKGSKSTVKESLSVQAPVEAKSVTEDSSSTEAAVIDKPLESNDSSDVREADFVNTPSAEDFEITEIAREFGKTWTFDKNRYVSKTGFGGNWTNDELKSMRARFEAAGITTSIQKPSDKTGDNNLTTRFRIYDHSRSNGVEMLWGKIQELQQKAQEKKWKAEEEAELKRNADILAAADPAALKWIEGAFGKGFANAYNTAGLADYISGKVNESNKFMLNSKWIEGLEKLGLVKDQKADIPGIKKAYKKSLLVETAAVEALAAPAVGAEAKPARKATTSPAHRAAMALIYGNELLSITKVIENNGKIARPNFGMRKIVKNAEKSRNLTGKELKVKKSLDGYDDYLSKNAFGNDENGKVAQELHDMLFSDSPTSRLDDWAITLGVTNDEAMIKVMDELIRVSRGKLVEQENPLDRELSAEEERQMMDFGDANQYFPNRVDMLPQDMILGSTITMDGESLTLIAKLDGKATFEDGTRFGTQRVSLDQSFWFDAEFSPFFEEEMATAQALVDEAVNKGYESSDELVKSEPEILKGLVRNDAEAEEESDFGGSTDDRSPTQDERAVSLPASKMDIRNSDSKELFGDDGGFKLGQQDTTDGDEVVAARKAKEDAAKATDEAQGKMFEDVSAKPAEEVNPALIAETISITRSKPKSAIEFKSPITGPTGAKIDGYVWKYRLEEGVDKRGEDSVTRVSDWEKAETSDQTGREVVHQFYITTPDGKVQIVSLETAIKALGYTDEGAKDAAKVKGLASMLKTRAKNEIAADRLRQAIAEFEVAKAEVYALALPEVSKEMNRRYAQAGKDVELAIYSMGDAKSFPDYNEEGPKIWMLSESWRENRLKERGFPRNVNFKKAELAGIEKRIAKQTAAINVAVDNIQQAKPTQEAKPTEKVKGLDHGILNIPGRLKNLDAEIDRYKAQAEKERKATARKATDDRKGSKAEAKLLLAKHGAAMNERYAVKFGAKEVSSILLDMVKWNPTKFIELANLFVAESNATPTAPQPDEEKGQGKLQDFGQKLEGARKDSLRSISTDISDNDLESQPLSKIWPKSEVDAIEDISLAAIAHAVREEVPVKPKAKDKVERWARKVKAVREIMRYVEEQGASTIMKGMDKPESKLASIADKIRLLIQIPRDQWGRVGSVKNYPDAISYVRDEKGERVYEEDESGVRVPKRKSTPYADVEIDGKGIRASDMDEVKAQVKKLLGESSAPAGKPMQFEIRSPRSGGNYSINKKGDPLYRKLATFPSLKEARSHLNNQYEALASAWDNVKQSDNVKETDVRRKTNRRRVGKNHLQGKDATAELFGETFGFRGVQFGNWVADGGSVKDRQGMLNMAYEALLDLSDILGIPTQAISLQGSLGLSFGARGSGKASAHFEQGSLVINLTKTRGAGSLAHEWFHALDNYFRLKRPKLKISEDSGNFITAQPETYYVNAKTGIRVSKSGLDFMEKRGADRGDLNDWKRVEGVRPEVEERFAELVKALDESPMNKRATTLDKGRSGDYWSKIIERAARAFENYTIFKMHQQGYHNDYLANVTEAKDFVRDAGRYPYLLDTEIAPIAEAFDSLFGTIESEPTAKGTGLRASPLLETEKPLRADSPEWKSMTKEQRTEYVKSKGNAGLKSAPLLDDDGSSVAESFKKNIPVNKAQVDEARLQQDALGNVATGKLAGFGNQRSRKEQDIVDAIYEFQKVVKTNADAMAVARKRLADNPADIEAKLLDAATDKDFALDTADHLAMQLLINKRSAEAGNDVAKHNANMSLRMAYRLARADAARILQVGYDRFMTPEERRQAALADAIYTPSAKIEKLAMGKTLAQRKEFIRRASEDRLAKIQKKLDDMGVSLAEATGNVKRYTAENNKLMREMLKTRNVMEQDIVKMVQKGWAVADIKRRYKQDDATIIEIIEKARADLGAKYAAMLRSGKTKDEIRQEMAAGLKASPLGSAAEPSDEDIARMVQEMLAEDGLSEKWQEKKKKAPAQQVTRTPKAAARAKTPDGILDDWMKRSGKKKTPAQVSEITKLIRQQGKRKIDETFAKKMEALGVSSAKVREVVSLIDSRRSRALDYAWSRPMFEDGMNKYVFDTKDRAAVMKRFETIHSLANTVGKIANLTGKTKTEAEALLEEINDILAKYGTDATAIFETSKPIEDYNFDINDISQVAQVARAISSIDADWIDKAGEYLYAGMLSGFQTMAVNATAVVPAAWETTVGRGFEMALNLAFKDPMAAQWGEEKYILKALIPSLTRAYSNAVATWTNQHPMFERDVLGIDVDWERILGGKGYRTGGSISGKTGDIVRMPMRLLAATDDFNLTLFDGVNVASYAFRLGKAQGMKPGSPELEKFIRVQVNTPGSISHVIAATNGKSAIFSNALPGQKDPVTGKIVPVRDLFGDSAGRMAAAISDFSTQEHENRVMKAFFAVLKICFFPFQRTPFNILRKGVRHTLNPFSLADITVGFWQSARTVKADGTSKMKWKIEGFDEESMDRRLHRADLIKRASQQLQGGMLMLMIAGLAAGEGDEDDQDKWMVWTGSSPFTPRGRAERDAQTRSGIGPYRISFRRKDGTERFGFNYGRLEPLATTLAATIDMMKAVKRSGRSGKDSQGTALEALGGFVAQAQDKSFMRGISDLIALATNAVAEPDVKENRKLQQFFASRVAMVVPNIIKQPIREADSVYRERSQNFMEELLYSVAPYGQKEAKIDPYGRQAVKTGTAAGRVVDVADIGTDKVHPIDAMLLRFRDKYPAEAWFPSPIVNAEFKHRVTGKEVKMSESQLAEFRSMAGTRTDTILKREAINFSNPSKIDIAKVKKSVTQARTDVKNMLSFKFSRQQ